MRLLIQILGNLFSEKIIFLFKKFPTNAEYKLCAWSNVTSSNTNDEHPSTVLAILVKLFLNLTLGCRRNVIGSVASKWKVVGNGCWGLVLVVLAFISWIKSSVNLIGNGVSEVDSLPVEERHKKTSIKYLRGTKSWRKTDPSKRHFIEEFSSIFEKF